VVRGPPLAAQRRGGYHKPNPVVGPCVVHGAAAQLGDVDSEETIFEFTHHHEDFLPRRGKIKNNKKNRGKTIGAPKCFQFAKATMKGNCGRKRKGGLGEGSSKLVEQPVKRKDKGMVEVSSKFTWYHVSGLAMKRRKCAF